MLEKLCSIEGCGGKVLGRGWCSKHYQRWWKFGDSLEMRQRRGGLIVVEGPIAKVELTKGNWAILDVGDVPLVDKMAWHYGTHGYALCRHNSRIVGMHQVVMGKAPIGMVIDHINGNRLDNRRCNLRFCTQSENAANSWKIGDLPRGVRRSHNRYCAFIRNNKKLEYLGSYSTPEEAARAHDRRAIEIHGECAMTNDRLKKLKPAFYDSLRRRKEANAQ